MNREVRSGAIRAAGPRIDIEEIVEVPRPLLERKCLAVNVHEPDLLRDDAERVTALVRPTRLAEDNDSLPQIVRNLPPRLRFLQSIRPHKKTS